MEKKSDPEMWVLACALFATIAVFIVTPGLGGGLVYEPLPLAFFAALVVGAFGSGVHAYVAWKITRDVDGR